MTVLNLDHFKAVNDTYGHPVGDALLCRVVEICAGLLPPPSIFTRLGGKEFGALLPRYNREHPKAVRPLSTKLYQSTDGLLSKERPSCRLFTT